MTNPAAAATDAHAIDFLHHLVATPSVSGSEQSAVRLFVDTARAIGLDAHIDRAGNGIAVTAGEGHPGDHADIVLLGHIDTVRGELPVRIADGVLHGRGAVDAKGPLAAMLFAAARVTPQTGTRVVVAAAVGEETSTSPGARHLVHNFNPAACIIGEPSNWDAVTLGYKGRLIADYHLERSCGHSAGEAGSPADAALAWWQRVLHWAEQRNTTMDTPTTAAFETLQATIHDINTTSDGLTDRVHLRAGFRLPPSMSPAAVSEALDSVQRDQATLDLHGGETAHRTDRSDPVVTALSGAIRASGARPRHKLKTGTADLNVVAPIWNCPIAAYGPGDSALDHTPTEHLPLDDYTRAIAVLESALVTLSARFATVGSNTN